MRDAPHQPCVRVQLEQAATHPTHRAIVKSPPVKRCLQEPHNLRIVREVPIRRWRATRSAEFLGESDEKPFRPADVTEPIDVFILDYFAYELCAALAEPFKRLVDVVHGEHDAEVAQSVHRSASVIRDSRRREEAGELDAAMAVGRAHHGNLDALIA